MNESLYAIGMKVIILFLCFGYSSLLWGWEIAVLDTGICPERLSIPKNYEINFASVKQSNCKKKEKLKLASHGQWVLETLFKLGPLEEKVKVHYFSVFEKTRMSPKKISAALSRLKQQRIDFILFAGGVPLTNDTPGLRTEHLILTASGQIGRGITEQTKLWPQNTLEQKKMIIGYYKQLKSSPSQRIFSPGQLNQAIADVFLPHRGVNSELKMSSFATAAFAGIVLQACRAFNSDCLDSLVESTVIDKLKVSILKRAWREKI